MFKNSIKQLFTCILITLFAMSCDGDSHGHDEDGLTVSGNDVAIAIVVVEGEEHEHDEDECSHATCVYGFQFEEYGQENFTYRQLNGTIPGNNGFDVQSESLIFATGEAKEFSVHFLDANGDELHEDDGDEEHGMHIEIEGVSAGTTTFQIELMHDGHSDFTSLPISVTVE